MPRRGAVAKSGQLAALEQALEGGSDADFLVYADLLEQGGDPRGRLIHLQHQLDARPRDHVKLRAAESAWMKKHASVLLGPLARWELDLTWKLGFVDKMKPEDDVERDDVAPMIGHPSARYVRHLEVLPYYSHAPGIVLLLAATPRPALRSLVLRQGNTRNDHAIPRAPGHPTYLLWGLKNHDHKRGDALWRAVPNLERLALTGFSLFHTLALPKLTELELDGHPICTTWQLPKLEKLSWTLDRDDSGTGVDWNVGIMDQIWKAKLPALRHLDLSKCQHLGCKTYGSYTERPDEVVIDPEDVLRRQVGFRKLAPRLDELVLPRKHLKSKAAIKKWLATR